MRNQGIHFTHIEYWINKCFIYDDAAMLSLLMMNVHYDHKMLDMWYLEEETAPSVYNYLSYLGLLDLSKRPDEKLKRYQDPAEHEMWAKWVALRQKNMEQTKAARPFSEFQCAISGDRITACRADSEDGNASSLESTSLDSTGTDLSRLQKFILGKPPNEQEQLWETVLIRKIIEGNFDAVVWLLPRMKGELTLPDLVVAATMVTNMDSVREAVTIAYSEVENVPDDGKALRNRYATMIRKVALDAAHRNEHLTVRQKTKEDFVFPSMDETVNMLASSQNIK
jgi:hypothetical protein